MAIRIYNGGLHKVRSFLKACTQKMYCCYLIKQEEKEQQAVKLTVLIFRDQVIPYNVALQQSVDMLHLIVQNYKMITIESKKLTKLKAEFVNLQTRKNGQPISGLDKQRTLNLRL